MKKNILIHGLISGTIVSVLMLVSMSYFSHCEGSVDMGTSMLIGYASMLLAFALVFVGIRNYRDKYNGGVISFGKAFKIGALIMLIASTMYALAWLVDFLYFVPDFMDKYITFTLEELKAGGASAEEVSKQAAEMEEFAELYKNPIVNILFTYMEIVPIGLLVTLISALILKRKYPKNEAITNRV